VLLPHGQGGARTNAERHAMVKDIQETEYRSPRDYDEEPSAKPTPNAPPVPRLHEIQVGSLSTPQFASKLFADQDFVVFNGKLKPKIVTAPYQVHIFQHSSPTFVPIRIAAVVPGGLKEFTRALIFFHPLPTKQAGYEESQYAAQTGGWRKIYRYCDQQGVQLAAADRKLVLIFPIFNLASTETCGRFPLEWKSLIEEIMVLIRKSHTPGLANEAKPKLTEVVTASFSAGVKYMHTFLTKATDLSGSLKEVYDYDGRFSTHRILSEKLGVHGAKVVIYDQRPTKETDIVKEFDAGKGIHVPEPRWRDLPDNRTSFLDIPIDDLARPIDGSRVVHGAIPRYLMFHSLKKSTVG